MKLKEQKIINKESNDKQNAPSSSLKSHKKISISILFEKVCLRWKLFPIINRLGEWGWNNNVLRQSKN